MDARVHRTTAEFRETAWPILAADPIKHTIILTATAQDVPDALLITLHDNGNLAGAVIRTDPYPLVVSAMPVEAAEFTAATVHELLPALPAVNGPIAEAEAFVTAWTRLTGTTATRTLATRLFKLGELKPPLDVPGSPRMAAEDDLPLLFSWIEVFMNEALPPTAKHAPSDGWARSAIAPGAAAILWELNGIPVSLAAVRGPVAGMSRVAPVYTPAEHRGHGYASAATAAITQWALDQGSETVLISTDLTNSTTNHIYPAIGYNPIGDSAEFTFTASGP